MGERSCKSCKYYQQSSPMCVTCHNEDRWESAVKYCATLEDKNRRLRGALKFYAEGEWSDGYPGGVRYAENDEICLDFGDRAVKALKEKK